MPGGPSVTTSVVSARLPNTEVEHLQHKARETGYTTSRYIAELISRDLGGRSHEDRPPARA
jgi:hypothetical protein